MRRILLLAGLALLLATGFYLALSPVRQSPAAPRQPVSAGVVATPPTVPPNSAAPLGLASNAPPASLKQPISRELDISVNPYAGALREPGKSKRQWDPGFLTTLQNAASGDPIRFELTQGQVASGTIRITQSRDGLLTYISGELNTPEAGKFFFLTPPAGGKAGSAVGVVEFPASQTAYRIEPTGPNGSPELWQRRLDEVVCVGMPRAESAATSTNETANMPPLRPDNVADYVPSYNSNIVSLQSYPGSSAVLLLNFFGGYTPTWGGIAFSRPAAANNSTIKDLWKRVAEDYMGFNINVTTDIKVYYAAPANSRQQCCFTDTPVTAAGVAYIGSWNWGTDTPCWSVYTTGKNGAEVGAHEPGHTLGLSHQGTIVNGVVNEYYSGQGSGATGWAPIMGVGYYQPVSTWAKGEYLNANNTQDEQNIITTANNRVTYRPDDTGSTLATSRYLEVYPDFSASAEGVIEQTSDTDAFQFTTSGGQVSLTANPVGDWADLAVMATLADATDTIIASNNPQSILSATITTNLPAGTYTFRVTGAGRNSPLTNGFSPYASRGYYSVAGWVAGARLPTRLSILEHSPNGTLVGTVPASTTTNLLAYAILSGNTGNTFSVDTNGVVQVADNTLLDYVRLGTNTMLPVEFELLVNITNLDDATQTELGRRVVVAVLKQAANYPIAVTGFNAGVIAPYYATPAAPQATGFDIPNNYSFYETGLSGNAQVGGTGGMQGLPPSGTVLSASDGTSFQLGPYGATNVLLMGYTYPNSGTLTLSTPQAYNSISILASSANGGGNGSFYLQFTNGVTSPLITFNAQDWFGTINNVAVQGMGRLKLGQATLSTENPGWNNPNLYQTTISLAALGYNLPIASLTFTKPSASSTTGVFALSGAQMPPQVSIARQPQSTTNNVPSSPATFSVVAMGAAPLGYQWYYGPTGGAGTFASLDGQTNASFSLAPVLRPTNAGSFYVVVTNSTSAATSSVATLTVFRAPLIARQPGPTNLVLLTGVSNTLSVVAYGALPLSYYWSTNGAFIPAANSAALVLKNLQVSNSANYAVVVSNAFGSVTSSIVSLTVLPPPSPPFAQAVLADRPLAYWRLDEPSGTIAHDYVSGLNGIYNKVLLGQAGNNLLGTNTSARFGALAPNTSLVTNIPIDFTTSTSANFTIETWVNGNAQSADNGLVTKGAGAGGEQFNLDCGGANHGFRFFVRDSTGATHAGSSSAALDSKWHHVVGVCDQTHSNVWLYIDGASAGQSSIVPGSGLLTSSNSVTLGCRQSGSSTFDLQFVGYMEEVAIYNYALSPAQVQTHYRVVTNLPPVFASNPFIAPDANAGQFYSGSIAGSASDPSGATLTFSKASGPGWLAINTAGGLTGTPFSSNDGTNSFLVKVTDSLGASSTATMYLNVNPAPPIGASLSPQGPNLLLSWGGGIAPYQVQMATNLASPVWQTVGGLLIDTNFSIPATNDAAFYRVQGQ
ncbi:MAG TPA: LamG-like jellyroll fold domain-containing protein [Candidatus Acidoferrum sp.]|jgi:hypothetical protein|nr:LamG-like jellyroll fold domain-containing protein [Candidatus Acidoferrum sp.]